MVLAWAYPAGGGVAGAGAVRRRPDARLECLLRRGAGGASGRPSFARRRAARRGLVGVGADAGRGAHRIRLAPLLCAVPAAAKNGPGVPARPAAATLEGDAAFFPGPLAGLAEGG